MLQIIQKVLDHIKQDPNYTDPTKQGSVPLAWQTMKKGGKVKSKPRGVGCAQRGHGKGKMR